MSEFASRLIAWQKLFGRQDLPWQRQGAYQVWVSEVMLQQTQVTTVVPYYLRFMESFPDIAALAAASMDEVLSHWSGLGYYARGRNLHRAAQMVVEQYQGVFPQEFEQIVALPGIGRSTAAAICALAYHQSKAILDGNVKRVLARYLAIEGVTSVKSVEQALWCAAELLLPAQEIAIYIQAQMDLGATVCMRSKPKCQHCPVAQSCLANQQGRVAELPTAKKSKAVPEKYAVFLVFKQQNQIYLSARPPVGIWGGLWSLPQIDVDSTLSQAQLTSLLDTQGVVSFEALPQLEHRFTHFKLYIQPVLIDQALASGVAESDKSAWYEISQALKIGLPKPIREILIRLKSDQVFAV